MRKSKETRIPKSSHEVPITQGIRDTIFSIPLLPQSEIVKEFDKLDRILNRFVSVLCREVPLIRDYYIDIVERIASGNTLGRNFYDKIDGEDGKAKAKKTVILQPSELRVLRKGMLLCNPDISPEAFSDIVQEMNFLRGVGEEAVELFLEKTKDFRTNHRKYIKYKRDMSVNYLQYERNLESIYEAIGVYDSVEVQRLLNSAEKAWGRYIELRSEIIKPYLRMVYKWANEFSSSDLQTLDNFQSGTFGLVRAIKNYTPARFAHFSVVAEQWVRQSILHYLKTDVNFIRLPMANWHYLQKIDKAKSKIEFNRSADATTEEIAKEIGVPEAKIKKIMENAQLVKIFSLNAPTTNEDNGQDASWNLESIAAEDDVEQDILREAELKIIHEVVGFFDHEEKIIFGLISGCHDIIPDAEFTEEEILKERLRQKAAAFGLGISYK